MITALEEALEKIEHSLDHTLPHKEREFLLQSYAEFIVSSMDKYVKGSLEHADESGDFLNHVDHHREIGMEIRDLMHYWMAIEWKKRRLP